jgi:hypothetical protein
MIRGLHAMFYAMIPNLVPLLTYVRMQRESSEDKQKCIALVAVSGCHRR